MIQKLIIDCDPGQDDAINLFLALPPTDDYEILGITVVAGYGRFDAEKYGSDGAPLHDPCTMAYILKPELFDLKDCNIRVEANSELTRGHTVVDFWHATELPRNSFWAYKVDADGFFDLLVGQLGKYT